MNKDYVIMKLAALTGRMVSDALAKLHDVNKYHLDFIKDPNYTLSKAHLIKDDAAKLFLQQQKHVKNSEDVTKWIEKNMNTGTFLITGINSRHEQLGVFSSDQYALLKELEGANKLKAKRQMMGWTQENADQLKGTYERFTKKVYKNHEEEAADEAFIAKSKGLVAGLDNKQNENNGKRNRILKKVLRKTWNE